MSGVVRGCGSHRCSPVHADTLVVPLTSGRPHIAAPAGPPGSLCVCVCDERCEV